MSSVSTAYENFVFKSFNLWGRASRSEFWLVMPVIWAAIVVFLVMDLQQVWGQLRQEQIPSLNPFDYGSVLLFVISWPARIAVTVRRLHDSGRSGKWAAAPYKAALLAFWFTIGITTAAMTAIPEVGAAVGVGIGVFGFGLVSAMFSGSVDFWPVMFEVAKHVDLWTLFDAARETVGGIVGHIGGNIQIPDPVTLAESYGEDYGIAPVATAPMMMVLFLLTFGPVILVGLWLMFLVMPGNPDHNRFGDPSRPAERITASGKGKHNAYAGYAALSVGAKTKATDPERRQAEVAALYRARVLGKTD